MSETSAATAPGAISAAGSRPKQPAEVGTSVEAYQFILGQLDKFGCYAPAQRVEEFRVSRAQSDRQNNSRRGGSSISPFPKDDGHNTGGCS